MSPGTGTCDPDIEIASATEFLLRNKKKANNFIWGELDGLGYLSFIAETCPRMAQVVEDGGCLMP